MYENQKVRITAIGPEDAYFNPHHLRVGEIVTVTSRGLYNCRVAVPSAGFVAGDVIREDGKHDYFLQFKVVPVALAPRFTIADGEVFIPFSKPRLFE